MIKKVVLYIPELTAVSIAWRISFFPLDPDSTCTSKILIWAELGSFPVICTYIRLFNSDAVTSVEKLASEYNLIVVVISVAVYLSWYKNCL